MFKSIAVVVGSYLLSVVLVIASDPLLSRLFPDDFVKGRVPSNNALLASTAFFVVVSILCAWICAPLRSKSRGTPCPLVLYPGRTNGNRRNHPQLEQRLASLVLAVLAAYLANQLLDRPGSWADAAPIRLPPDSNSDSKSKKLLKLSNVEYTRHNVNYIFTLCLVKETRREAFHVIPAKKAPGYRSYRWRPFMATTSGRGGFGIDRTVTSESAAFWRRLLHW